MSAPTAPPAGATGGRVMTLVRFATPGPAPDGAALRALLERTAPVYRSVPGLLRKWFLSAEGVGGGCYEWRSRADAETWFDDAWRSRMRAAYGVEPSIEGFDAPGVVDNLSGQIEFGGSRP